MDPLGEVPGGERAAVTLEVVAAEVLLLVEVAGGRDHHHRGAGEAIDHELAGLADLQVLDHVGDQDSVEFPQRGHRLLGRGVVDLVVGVVVDRVAIRRERLDPFDVHLPGGPLDPLVPDVGVFPVQHAVLAEAAADVQQTLGPELGQDADDRGEVVRVGGGHVRTVGGPFTEEVVPPTLAERRRRTQARPGGCRSPRVASMPQQESLGVDDRPRHVFPRLAAVGSRAPHGTTGGPEPLVRRSVKRQRAARYRSSRIAASSPRFGVDQAAEAVGDGGERACGRSGPLMSWNAWARVVDSDRSHSQVRRRSGLPKAS